MCNIAICVVFFYLTCIYIDGNSWQYSSQITLSLVVNITHIQKIEYEVLPIHFLCDSGIA